MDFVVQKATELGVSTITPIVSSKCFLGLKKITELYKSKIQHLQNIAIGASEQCGRVHIPQIMNPIDFTTFVSLDSKSKNINRIICTQQALNKISIDNEKAVSVLIGPESGFTTEEIELATLSKFLQMGLGPRILRAETASIAAVSKLMTITNNL